MRRRGLLASKTFPDRERTREGSLPTQFLCNEILSSGYNTDQHDDIPTDTNEDYLLWNRREPEENNLLHENTTRDTKQKGNEE